MNILITDDSKLNRIVIKELIKEFETQNGKKIKTSEAEDGLIAIEACRKEFFDLVFMDIMMPNMDGIAATKIIHNESKNTMIIAVSAVEDDANKRDILKNGAEDYIQKPINGEIFLKRLAHYISIIESRSNLRPRQAGIDVINPFDANIYNRRLSFLVFDQASLGEFWDYYMQSEHNEILADLIRLFYGLGIWQLKLSYRFYIFVEENSDFWYFTMTNAKLLNHDMLLRIITKNYPNGIFDIVADRVSFCIPKTPQSSNTPQPIKIEPAVVAIKEPVINIPIQPMIKTEVVLSVFDFIDQEDLEELLEINDNLRSLMLVVGSSDLELDEIRQIAEYLQKFGRIISKYHEVYVLATVIRELGTDIQNNAQVFKDRSGDIAQLCQAFNNDLAVWLRKLFVEGAVSVDFMDQSLTSDANMLASFLKPKTDEAVDLDDIFDF